MIYKSWWMFSSSLFNFGDVLTPKILEYYNIKYEFCKNNFNLMSVGSIAHRAPDNCIVLGSGIMWENSILNLNAKWKFVRGPHTRQAIIKSGGHCPEIYGDPALLLPMFCNESKKEYDVGIAPHTIDYDIVKEKFPKYNIINLNNSNPLEVAKEITKCRSIISSSLHGIICAHAYNIPCAWVKFSDRLKGDGIKFKDHYESIGLKAEISTIESPKFTSIHIDCNQIKKINDIFISLK